MSATTGPATTRAANAKSHRFFDLPAEAADPATARATLLPVPYDATASWQRGTANGPDAMREASRYVEAWDIETRSEPWRQGIAEVEPVDCDGCTPEEMARRVEARMTELFAGASLPVMLGGEHSVTIGAVRAAAGSHRDVSVLQLDAHGDTRQSYHGSDHNHACVMARAREVCPIVQVGLRSVAPEEMAHLDPERVVWAHDIVRATDDSWLDRAISRLTETVYVTIDVDVFDPGFVPATGTPEPGGLDWYQVNRILARVAQERRVVGFDIVELMPGHPPSAFLAAKLLYRFLAEIWAT